MAQEQNYQVDYTINVNASQGTKQVMAFGEAVGKLVQAKASLTPAVTNIKNMMDEIDRVFRTKNGKKRSFDYRLTIDTKNSEQKLERVKSLLTEISTLSKGINLTINAGPALDTKRIKANAKSLYEKKAAEMRKAEVERSAASSVTTMADAQKRITKAIGKINSALVSVSQGRELNIKTDVAERRLQKILSLLGQLKSASSFSLNIRGGLPAGAVGTNPIVGTSFPHMLSAPVPFAPQPFVMPEKSRQKLMERLYTDQQMHRQRMAQEEERYAVQQRRNSLRKTEQEEERGRRNVAREAERLRRQAEAAKHKEAAAAQRAEERRYRAEIAEQQRAERAARRREQRTAMQSVRLMQREHTAAGTLYRSKRRAAINRIQYSKAPSLRNLPFASMFNAYMGYSLVRSELTKAIDYSNIMESAHSILRVADADLKTFETRFDEMARHVRKIGIDTKFTAVEIAGAVKYLSMAGMNIETIHKSIRPITNLALIGDNDVSYIADLATNIMAGYDINNESMDSVADIIASTISRSNVNIVEVAESYKMAAGYLRMAGVDFTEATAAIGLLGNMGLKGTLAGTSLRAMATRFAKPTKESQKVLDRLGVKFTEQRNIEGVMVEKLRPIADIFEELNRKGASMADMQAIFGKIGGNAAMMLVRNYDQLRSLTTHNRGSQGISSELALVKQNTTKGLWAQVTSQLTESFMQAYQILEPTIRSVLRSLLGKFKAPEFTRGLVAIGNALLDVFTVIGNIGAWVTRNFHWIEPMLFTGVVATKLFKIAGALTNIGIAVGFIGKQSAAAGTIEAVQGLIGLGGIGRLSFAHKRAIVSTMRAAGVTGRGAMMQALLAGGGTIGAKNVLQSLFATQVATGSGLTGAAASLSAITVAATAGLSALVGVLGWVAYKTWKVKEAKDAVLEEIAQNRKYRYPSIEALYSSLSETYNMAMKTKRAVDEVVAGKNIEEASGHKIGRFTPSWWTSFAAEAAAMLKAAKTSFYVAPSYSEKDAEQDDIRAALTTLAARDSQTRINAAYTEFGKLGTVLEVDAFLKTVRERYGQQDKDLDKTLWYMSNGKAIYASDIGDKPEEVAAQTYDYARYMNEKTVPEIIRAATLYRNAISSPAKAQELMRKGGFDFEQLAGWGFSQDKDGHWVQRVLGKDATDEQRVDNIADRKLAHNSLVKFFSSLRQTFGGSAEAAENILRVAGFTPDQYSNEPDSNDMRPFATNPITNNHLPDDGGAGGNYSGTGKLSSAAPKQVIVNIDSLLSVKTIDLMKTKEGQREEIQNLKQQLAEALIDVVHDFDASWNA